MRSAFLEYSYSVIYSRALPDARDGLKPVQRRILYGDERAGPAPRPRPREVPARRRRGHGQVPPARRPGDLRRPGADGAAVHACACRSSTATATSARSTTARPPRATPRPGWPPPRCSWSPGLDEDTVDFVPNYDDTQLQPGVLPAAYPNLLVNGAAGIAVGMATNMPPHNLVEVIGAARHLIANPTCSLDDLMKFVPGPDLPVRRQDRRARGHPRRLPHRPRQLPHPRDGTHRVDHAAAQGHRRHRAALPRRTREGHRQGQGPRPGQEAAGHRRPQGPLRPRSTACGSSSRSRTASTPTPSSSSSTS